MTTVVAPLLIGVGIGQLAAVGIAAVWRCGYGAAVTDACTLLDKVLDR